MPVPTGAASFLDIQTNFGGSTPISLSEYYAGGGLTKSNVGVHAPNGIPSSGAISVNDFRGAGNFSESWSTTVTEAGGPGSGYNSRGYSPGNFGGSMGDVTPDLGQVLNGLYTIQSSSHSETSPKIPGNPNPPTINNYGIHFNSSAHNTYFGNFPSSAEFNTDLNLFKTVTINGRGTYSRSTATFTNFPTNVPPGFSLTFQDVGGYPPANATRTFSMTNA